jgi:hypothetical protein
MPRIPRTQAWSALNQLAQRVHESLLTLLTLRPPLQLRPVPVPVPVRSTARVQRPERREPPGF